MVRVITEKNMKIKKYEKDGKVKEKPKGFFIVIDGGDGAGTTSVSKEIVKRLGWNALYTREPGGSPYAEKIREVILSDYAKMSDAKTQFALFWGARRDHLVQTVRPAVEKGKIVICDRFDSTTYAYQIVAQENYDLEDLFWVIRKSYLEGVEPDLYILLDVPVKVGLERTRKRNEKLNYFDKMKLNFHEKGRKGFHEFVGDKITNGHIIDASKTLDEVVEDTLAVIEEFVK